MNLQHARIAALCKQLKLDRLPAEWPSVAQATIDNSGTGRVRQGGVNSDPAFRSGNMSVKR
ncbi:hypothetical protein WKI72_00585 [Candidatus Erwinia dacicola]